MTAYCMKTEYGADKVLCQTDKFWDMQNWSKIRLVFMKTNVKISWSYFDLKLF